MNVKPAYSATSDQYYCPTQDTDWKNDDDIRTKNLKSQSSYNLKYEVPISNCFACLTQGSC